MRSPTAVQAGRRLADRPVRLEGAQSGAAGVHDRQALVLVNRGGATAADIMALAGAIQESVAARYGVALEPEPVRV